MTYALYALALCGLGWLVHRTFAVGPPPTTMDQLRAVIKSPLAHGGHDPAASRTTPLRSNPAARSQERAVPSVGQR